MLDYFDNPAAFLCQLELKAWIGRMKGHLADVSNSPRVSIHCFGALKKPKYEVWVYPNGYQGGSHIHKQKSYFDAVNFAHGQTFPWYYVTDSTTLSLTGGKFFCKKGEEPNFIRQLSPTGRSIYRRVKMMNKKKHLVKFMGYVLGQTPNWKNRKHNGR